MHGYEQSQALTRAAQKLSRAREILAAREEMLVESSAYAPGDAGHSAVVSARENVERAKLAYQAAYKAYTNPFGAVKTV